MAAVKHWKSGPDFARTHKRTNFSTQMRQRYFEGLLVRDGEACAADLQRVFGLGRAQASMEISRYKKIWRGVRYSGPAKRYVAWASFEPVLMSRQDARLYADMVEIIADIHADAD